MEETREFYETAMGMTNGDRPPLPFPGYWMYLDGKAVIHIVGIDENDPSGLIDYLGDVDLAGARVKSVKGVPLVAVRLCRRVDKQQIVRAATPQVYLSEVP